jgi:hypothetical protein
MKDIHSFYHGKQWTLRAVGDVSFRANQECPWTPDNPLIRPAASRRWQDSPQFLSPIDTNDGKVPGLEFPDIRAPSQSDGLLTIGMRVRAKSFFEHTNY